MYYIFRDDAEGKLKSADIRGSEIAERAGLKRFHFPRKRLGESIRGVHAWAIAQIYAERTNSSVERALNELFIPIPSGQKDLEGQEAYEVAIADMNREDISEVLYEGGQIVHLRKGLMAAAKRRKMRLRIIERDNGRLLFRLTDAYPSHLRKAKKQSKQDNHGNQEQ